READGLHHPPHRAGHRDAGRRGPGTGPRDRRARRRGRPLRVPRGAVPGDLEGPAAGHHQVPRPGGGHHVRGPGDRDVGDPEEPQLPAHDRTPRDAGQLHKRGPEGPDREAPRTDPPEGARLPVLPGPRGLRRAALRAARGAGGVAAVGSPGRALTVPVRACARPHMPARPVHRNAPVTPYPSLEDFLTRQTDPSGLVEIRHGLPLHLHWTDNGSDVTFIAFAGAMLSTTHTVPIFGGYTLTRKLESNVLLVSDPAPVLDTSLTIGWYAGTQQVDHLQRDLTGIIRSLVGRTRVVLFGPSGG